MIVNYAIKKRYQFADYTKISLCPSIKTIHPDVGQFFKIASIDTVLPNKLIKQIFLLS
jgi:hypothetical protein